MLLPRKMVEPLNKPERRTLSLELTPDGYMRFSKKDAAYFFPEDTLLALWRDESLLLLPTRGAAAGGMMLKQRNPAGDRTLLISEIFDFVIPSGQYLAQWDEAIGGLQVALKPVAEEHE